MQAQKLEEKEEEGKQENLETRKLNARNSQHNKKDNSSLVSLALVFIVFVVFPYELYVLGLSLVDIFALTVFGAGLLTDIFTTKAGFNRGYDDYNVFYSATKNKVRNNTFLIGIGIFGAIRAFLIYYFWGNAFILILVALMSLIGPLWNSVILSVPDDGITSRRRMAPLPQEKLTVTN